MAKINVLTVVVILCVTCVCFAKSEEFEYDYDGGFEKNDIEGLRQDLIDLEARMNIKMNRVQRVVKYKINKLLPQLLRKHLANSTDISSPQRHHMLNELGQMKSQMQRYREEAMTSMQKIETLETELENSLVKNHRLNQSLLTLAKRVDQLEQNHVDGKDDQEVSQTSVSGSSGTNRGAVRTGSSNRAWPRFTYPEEPSTSLKKSPVPVSTERTRLVAVTEMSGRFVEIQLDNEHMRNLTSRPGKIMDVVYHPQSDSVIYSSNIDPKGVFSFPLDNPTITKNISSVSATKMAVDEKKDWIFFISDEPFSVHRVDSTGRDYDDVYQSMASIIGVFDIALDKEKELLYISSRKVLVETDYDGMNARRIPVSGRLHHITFDNTNNLLYILDQEEEAIKTWDSETEEVETAMKVNRLAESKITYILFINDMAYNDGKLYFGGDFGSVSQMDVTTKSGRHLAEMKDDLFVNVCLIP